jgi:hypothetical protein
MTAPNYHSDTWGNRTHFSGNEKGLTIDNFYRTPAFSGVYCRPSPFPYFEKGRPGFFRRWFIMLRHIHRFRVQLAWNKEEQIFKDSEEYFPSCETKPKFWMPLHAEYKGKKFNGVVMKNAEIQMNMEKHIPAENFKRVCEIGAGYGAHVEMIIKRHDPEYFYIIDLPETIRLSRLYLSSVFPEKIDTSIIFVEANNVNSIDVPFTLFVNTNSLAEMPIETVKGYFEFMGRHPGAYLSATNPPRFEGDYLYAGPETYPYNDKWEIIWKGRQKLHYYRKNLQIISKVKA